MDSITKLTDIDLGAFFLICFLIMSAVISIFTVIGRFSEMIGKPVKWIRKNHEDHALLIKTAQNLNALQQKHEEAVKQSVHHDQLIKEDLSMVSDKLDALSRQISDMQDKMDETEMAKLKDTIVTYYRKYKDAGEWSQLESDAFWNLFRRYEAHGGNGFIHSVVEPAMREMRIEDLCAAVVHLRPEEHGRI